MTRYTPVGSPNLAVNLAIRHQDPLKKNNLVVFI